MRYLILLTACCALLAPPTPAVTAVAKKSVKKAPTKKASVPKPPPVTPQARAEASASVESQMADAVDLGIQNAAAMVPFYELMHRRQQNPRPLHVLFVGVQGTRH